MRRKKNYYACCRTFGHSRVVKSLKILNSHFFKHRINVKLKIIGRSRNLIMKIFLVVNIEYIIMNY